ncbi:MAG: magnesium transporter CorA family protein [Bythopirellula sp.]
MTSLSSAHNRIDLSNALAGLGGLPLECVQCHLIDREQARLIPLSTVELAEQWSDISQEVWMDIQADQPDQFQTFLEELQLHPLILEDCLEPFRSSRFSSFDSSMHFEFPVIGDGTADSYLSIVCVPGLLVTIRTTPIPAVDHLIEGLAAQVPLNEGSKSALLYAILDKLGDTLIDAVRQERSEVRRLSHSLDKQSDSVEIEQVIAVKRHLQDLTMIAEDQLYCVRALVAVESPALSVSSQRDYFRDAVRSFETVLRVVHRYEARSTELHQQSLLSLQARTESRIRILTILSSICMPLTLIAGIYGMNFSRMPELQSSWGYPVTLLIMAGIATGQMIFFYRRGWFG